MGSGAVQTQASSHTRRADKSLYRLVLLNPVSVRSRSVSNCRSLRMVAVVESDSLLQSQKGRDLKGGVADERDQRSGRSRR
jgi:hypothetical protein